MKLPELLDVWVSACKSSLASIPNVRSAIAAGTPWTMKLLMQPVQREEIPRGFASSADPAICYLVWQNADKELRFTLRCTCGLQKRIYPDKDGRCYYEHTVACCGWRVELVLEGYGRITETKEERAERRQQEHEARLKSL